MRAQEVGISVEEYLEAERDGEVRHEYLDGRIHAMTAASRRHALIVTALTLSLGPRARECGGQLFTNDMKVRVDLHGRTFFYYPDLVVSCDPEDRAEYFVTRPCLIVEVSSPATERIDRCEKLLTDVTIPSLQEYVLVSQEERLVEVYRRSDWLPEALHGGRFVLDCLDATLTVEEVYRDVSEPAAQGTGGSG